MRKQSDKHPELILKNLTKFTISQFGWHEGSAALYVHIAPKAEVLMHHKRLESQIYYSRTVGTSVSVM